jgi:hypothetical protein
MTAQHVNMPICIRQFGRVDIFASEWCFLLQCFEPLLQFREVSPSRKQNVNVTIAYKKPGPKLFQKKVNPRMTLAFDIGNEAGKCGRKTRRASRGAS